MQGVYGKNASGKLYSIIKFIKHKKKYKDAQDKLNSNVETRNNVVNIETRKNVM